MSPRTIRIHGRTRLLPPLSIRLSEAERAEVERRAKQVGLAVSEFARRAMLGSHLRSEASRLLAIGRNTLLRKLKEYGKA